VWPVSLHSSMCTRWRQYRAEHLDDASVKRWILVSESAPCDADTMPGSLTRPVVTWSDDSKISGWKSAVHDGAVRRAKRT